MRFAGKSRLSQLSLELIYTRVFRVVSSNVAVSSMLNQSLSNAALISREVIVRQLYPAGNCLGYRVIHHRSLALLPVHLLMERPSQRCRAQ
jgi:hypothetical protein